MVFWVSHQNLLKITEGFICLCPAALLKRNNLGVIFGKFYRSSIWQLYRIIIFQNYFFDTAPSIAAQRRMENLRRGVDRTRGRFRGGHRGCVPPLFFCNHLFFCSHFEELQTVLFEVELIINNAPLTYVYPNTIKTCVTPNHLLFGR